MESTLSSPCSRSDPPLAKMQLSSTLSLSPIMIWYSGQTALFLFLLARAAPVFLPTALPVALRPLFSFGQAQYVQVFPLKPAPFCMLFTGLGSTNKSAISHLFYYLTLVLFSPPSFLLSQTLWQIWQELLSPALSDCNGFPRHSFLLGNNAADELARQGALLAPSGIPCSLSSLISRIHFSFTWTGGILSHQKFLIHRFPQFLLSNLCSLVMLTVSSLVFAAMDTAFC